MHVETQWAARCDGCSKYAPNPIIRNSLRAFEIPDDTRGVPRSTYLVGNLVLCIPCIRKYIPQFLFHIL